MKLFKKTFFIFFFLISITIISCNKGNCYDENLYQLHKNDICLQNCPGVTGCDGKFYCNKCIANAQGIKVK